MSASVPARSRYDFRLRMGMRIAVERFGEEREPVLIIDDPMREPGQLVDWAADEAFFEPAWQPEGGYPGLRASAPVEYYRRLVRSVDPIVRRTFGLEGVRLANAACMFSLVTQPPEDLAPPQRIPHFDTADPLQFAFLHFLCDERFGGTAFYCHRATGFEAITPEREAEYEAARGSELAEEPPPQAYVTADTPRFAQTGVAGARFDRLIVYRSNVLHSGLIATPEKLSEDPRTGRLSANSFVTYRPAAAEGARV